MKPVTFWLFITALILVQCKTDTVNPFEIGPDHVGRLHKKTPVSQLDSIFANDSIIRDTSRLKMGSGGSIEIYEKGGKALLSLSATTDSLLVVENIRILDPRFKTEKGVGLQSTYGEIRKHYEIRKVITSMNNILILLKGSDLYFTISRSELPEDLRYSTASIEEVQIPDAARIKYMMVGWE
jgi:hypothetical protein